VHAIPSLLALVLAALLARGVLQGLATAGHVRVNYRGRPLPAPAGVLVVAASLLALAPLTLLQELAGGELLYPETGRITLYVLGVALLGLIDDLLGSEDPAARGWRGHARAVLAGRPSTGALKAIGTAALALLTMSGVGLSAGRYLLAAAVLVCATNLFNLLDLRPGRSTKAFVLLGASLAIGSAQLRTAWALGLFAAPAVLVGVYDLRERAMLGDTGANLLGALAGLWLVLTLSGTGQEIALGLLVLITVYGEFRSISKLVERTPGLRELDSWGRPS
jgi:UDP-GlcNAc:undecaprenyl-phosphate/decaprenyl-phosphate GlcNAc-1-phosphate transferase